MQLVFSGFNDANSFSEVAQQEFGFPSGMSKEDFDTFVRDNELLDSEFKIYDIGEVSEMCRKAKAEAGPDNM